LRNGRDKNYCLGRRRQICCDNTGIELGKIYKIKNKFSKNVLNSWGNTIGKGTATMAIDDNITNTANRN